MIFIVSDPHRRRLIIIWYWQLRRSRHMNTTNDISYTKTCRQVTLSKSLIIYLHAIITRWIHRYVTEITGHVIPHSFHVFVCCHIMCLYVLSSVLWCSLRFPSKNDFRLIRLYLQLFVGGRISYLRYLYLFAYSGVQRILLPVSLDCPLFIVPSIFSNVYFS